MIKGFFLNCFCNPTYLEIVFLVNRQAVGEDIACNNHVGLISIHGESVHPQKLRQQCVAMAFHNELINKTKQRVRFLKFKFGGNKVFFLRLGHLTTSNKYI